MLADLSVFNDAVIRFSGHVGSLGFLSFQNLLPSLSIPCISREQSLLSMRTTLVPSSECNTMISLFCRGTYSCRMRSCVRAVGSFVGITPYWRSTSTSLALSHCSESRDVGVNRRTRLMLRNARCELPSRTANIFCSTAAGELVHKHILALDWHLVFETEAEQWSG